MKVIPIKESVKTCLNSLFDAALKERGMFIHKTIQSVLNSVKEQEKQELDLTPELDKDLHEICDSALKHSGMGVHETVQQLISSVEDKFETLKEDV